MIMPRALLALACLATTQGSPVPTSDAASVEFLQWKQLHGKVYTAAEHNSRYAAWLDSRAFVVRHNAKAGTTWRATLNADSDLTWDEFKTQKLMAPQNCSATHTSSGWKPLQGRAAPDAIDWREKIPDWPVKSQGHCGSCWTFSTVGSMESHYYLKHAMHKNLSEQQLVDCAGRLVKSLVVRCVECSSHWFCPVTHPRRCAGAHLFLISAQPHI